MKLQQLQKALHEHAYLLHGLQTCRGEPIMPSQPLIMGVYHCTAQLHGGHAAIGQNVCTCTATRSSETYSRYRLCHGYVDVSVGRAGYRFLLTKGVH